MIRLSPKFAVLTAAVTIAFAPLASACPTIDHHRTIFLSPDHPAAADADFVGQVEIIPDEKESTSTIWARIIESETHPENVGETITLFVIETSCGPYTSTGDEGTVIAAAFGEGGKYLSFSPKTESLGVNFWRNIKTQNTADAAE